MGRNKFRLYILYQNWTFWPTKCGLCESEDFDRLNMLATPLMRFFLLNFLKFFLIQKLIKVKIEWLINNEVVLWTYNFFSFYSSHLISPRSHRVYYLMRSFHAFLPCTSSLACYLSHPFWISSFLVFYHFLNSIFLFFTFSDHIHHPFQSFSKLFFVTFIFNDTVEIF